MRALLVMSLVLASGCSKPKDGSSLAERVQFSCGVLADDLRQASERYTEYAGWMDTQRLSPEQQGRAERRLPYGGTDGERAVATRGLTFQFYLCARSRELDEQATDQLTIRASRLMETFTNPGPAEMARSIEGLATLAAEIRKLPVRD